MREAARLERDQRAKYWGNDLAKFRRIRHLGILIAGLTGLVLFFNNCTRSFHIKQLDGLSSKLEETASGNGYGYGGKIRTYNRYLPEFTCEAQPTALATLELNDTSAFFTKRNSIQCGALPQPIDLKDLDVSPLQDDVIGYDSGLFMNSNPTITGIPDKLTEAWCRDSQNPNIDVITYFDRIREKAYGKVYYRDPMNISAVVSIGEFSISRIISQHIINYSSNELELKIDRDQLASAPGTFWGNLNFHHLSVQKQSRVFCRIGGLLDPQIWPLKQINDINPATSEYDESSQTLIFNAQIPNQFGFGIYAWKNNKTDLIFEPKDIGSSSGALNFKLIDEGKLIFKGYDSALKENFYLLNIAAKNLTKLGGPRSQVSKGSDDLYTTVDLKKGLIYFRDDIFRSNIFGMQDLLASDFNGNTRRVSHLLSDEMNSEVLAYVFSPVTGTIAYTFKESTQPDSIKLAIIPSGTQTIKFVDIESYGYSLESPFIKIVGNDQQLILEASRILDGARVTANLSLTDYQLRTVRQLTGPGQAGVSCSSPNRNFLIYAKHISQSEKDREYFVRNISTWSEYSLGKMPSSEIPNIFIMEESEAAYFVLDKKLFKMDLNTGVQIELCHSSIEGDIISIKASEDASTILLAKSKPVSSGYVSSIFQMENDQCIYKNSVPAITPRGRLISFAKDLSGALLYNEQYQIGNLALVHMPLNGQPPVQVNSPAFLNSGLIEASYINNNKSIYFDGFQVSPSSRGLYIVNLPE